MSSVTANPGKSKSLVFETVLCSPGMNEKCKISLVLSRQNILLLCRLIEEGLKGGEGRFEDEILNALPKGGLEEFKMIHEEILRKTDLTDFYEKLKLLSQQK